MSYINNKKTSDIIKVETVPFLTYLKVGDNLRGKTIFFNTEDPFVGDSTKNIMTNHVSGGTAKDYIGCGIGEVNEVGYINAYLSEGGSDVTFIAKFTDSAGNWLMDHYTFPDDADIIIESITTVDFWTSLIKVDISVDTELNVDSDNPVTNKAITTKFNSVDSDINDLEGDVTELQNNTSDMADAIVTLQSEKADIDDLEKGLIVVGKSKTAKSLENVSEDSGSVQEDPFIFQGTGTNNNTSETPTSPVAKQLEKQGNSVVVTQTAKELNATNYYAQTSNSRLDISFASNVATLTLLAESSSYYDGIGYALNNLMQHKYLVIIKAKSSTSSKMRTAFFNSSTFLYIHSKTFNLTSSYANYYGILTCAGNNFSANANFIVGFGDGEVTNATMDIADIKICDITKWFGSNDLIPANLLAHPEKAPNYGITINLANKTGELVNSNGQYLVTYGFNQLNPATHKAYLIGGYEYEIVGNYTSVTYSTGETITITNRKFTPTNNGTLTVTGDDSTTCIHLVWDGERDGEYKDFVKKVYNTGTEVLRSAGSVRDVKTNDGTITRNVGVYTFTGNESGGTQSGYPYISIGTPIASNDITMADFQKVSFLEMDNLNEKTMTVINGNTGLIGFYSSATQSLSDLRTYLTGKTIYFALKTPTTETGTSFAEEIDVDDYGTMAWYEDIGLDEKLCEIPQGCKIFYPADYSLLVDDLGNYTEYDVTKLAKKTDINETFLNNLGFYKQEDLSSGITNNAGLTVSVSKLYKTGNIVNLTIVATNETGSEISANADLFTLPNSVIPTTNYNFPYYRYGSTATCTITQYGKVRSTTAIGTGNQVCISISYAIA